MCLNSTMPKCAMCDMSHARFKVGCLCLQPRVIHKSCLDTLAEELYTARSMHCKTCGSTITLVKMARMRKILMAHLAKQAKFSEICIDKMKPYYRLLWWEEMTHEKKDKLKQTWEAIIEAVRGDCPVFLQGMLDRMKAKRITILPCKSYNVL